MPKEGSSGVRGKRNYTLFQAIILCSFKGTYQTKLEKIAKKKKKFRAWFWPVWTKFGCPKFFLYWMLDIVASYRYTQFHGKLIQTQENGANTHFEPDLGPSDPNSDHHFFFLIWLPHTRYWSAIIMYNIWKKLWSNLRKI